MSVINEKELASQHKGLTAAEVEASRKKYGLNVLTPPKREPWWKLLLEKFDDPIIRILIIAACIAVGVGIVDGHYAEGIGIIIAILLATTISFFNEYKANKEFDILNQVNDDIPVKVIRDNNFTTIPKKEIVVGDMVIIELGEEIPADGQVLEAVSLQVNESCLTGESLPVRKQVRHHTTVQPHTAYPEDKLFRGTLVMDGHGMMKVLSIGDASEIGSTAHFAAEETNEETPLNLQLRGLSRWIGVVGFSIAAFIYISLLIRDIISGQLQLTSHQWALVAIFKLGVFAAMVKIWLPIVYDGFELFGKTLTRPAWLERKGFASWFKTIGIGLALIVIGMGAGLIFNFIPPLAQISLPQEVLRIFLNYFMIAVTIIVVAVPEGLAMSVTLSLAYSMKKMTRSNNLVRKLHACETIGAATVICSDKTGTLTKNEMKVHESFFPLLAAKKLQYDNPNMQEQILIEALAVNTTAHLDRQNPTQPVALGNPTEGALLLWLDQQGVDYVYPRSDFRVIYQWTFTTDRKYMATLGRSPKAENAILHVKGAPEIILNRCTQILQADGLQPLDEAYKNTLKTQLKSFQARGMRTLAFAFKEGNHPHEGVEIGELTHEMTWLGFVAISDPVRPDVPDAIKTCQKAGIAVKIVTGDNPETAKEIARQIQLYQETDGPAQCITGSEFEALSDKEAEEAALHLKVMARARPLDKLRLVRLLQKRGHIVAVTGDGTNDAPALNYANVGLSMGKTGTSIAKEASDIVLLDDSFRSIVNGVMWGRSLYENIQRFILFQLTINVIALAIALLGPFIGIKLPLTVTQMLWINLVMDTFAALALASEPPHWSVMNRPPRNPQDFIVTKIMAIRIFSTAALFLVFLVGFLLVIQRDGAVTIRELSIFFSLFVLLQFWNLFNARCLGTHQSAFKNLKDNKNFLVIATIIVVAQVLIVQGGGKFFRTEPLTLIEWVYIIGGTSCVLWIGELWRWFKRLQEPHHD